MISQGDIELAAKYIKEGKVVAFPTETVYGLGADALNPMAVAKIFELKKRPSFDPLIVHISDISYIKKLTKNNDDRIYKLAERFWPGPLTIVMKKSEIVPDIVTSGLPTVGIRMPDNKIALELITKSETAIAAPSANLFGRVSPTTAQHVKKQLKGVDFILDGGKTKVGIESTIIALNEEGFEILRYGLITKEEIKKVIPICTESKNKKNILAPGMLKSHYSPSKPLFILDKNILEKIDRKKVGLLSFSGKDTEGFKIVIELTKNQDLKEYAVNLFESMHKLEESDVEYIVAEPVPEIGVGLAIMDRLKKASHKK
ncbi:MAG TPA: L-threonylcarbamoyladenylate synthase [Spirochaetota bacterium]|jgi:L-threonylcarbamoyladenylate synthase|nr:L-threonylcarbamoyladenylate synthase [Bacteroidota bacterium]HRR61716.1 L-threonylcarbamoyladenylate synthase [Spirochaetota bacterium]